MFTVNASEVRVAVTGGIFVDLSGSAVFPTTGDGVLVGYDELGYATDSGIEQAITTSLSDLPAWQNADVVRKIQTSHDVTFATSLMQTNAKTAEIYYGNYDAVTKLSKLTGAMLPIKSWVFEVFDGDVAAETGQKIRVAVPRGQVTERGNISYTSTGAIVYPITLTAFPDDQGVKAYVWLVDLDGNDPEES